MFFIAYLKPLNYSLDLYIIDASMESILAQQKRRQKLSCANIHGPHHPLSFECSDIHGHLSPLYFGRSFSRARSGDCLLRLYSLFLFTGYFFPVFDAGFAYSGYSALPGTEC
jgi:hypothetical protein